jgi:two-component system cell cycle response regulator DivK
MSHHSAAGPVPDSAGQRGRPVRILVIEDDPVNLELDLALLEEEEHTVYAATSAEEGLRLASAERPDLILLDLQLPGLTGWEAARRLKADPATARIRIVALTAQAMEGDEARARAAGCDGYLSKPVDTTLLRTMIRQFLAEEVP